MPMVSAKIPPTRAPLPEIFTHVCALTPGLFTAVGWATPTVQVWRVLHLYSQTSAPGDESYAEGVPLRHIDASALFLDARGHLLKP